MRALFIAGAISRTRGAVIALLIALSLLLSALPAAAGPNASYGLPEGWDFLDPSGITWERSRKNITWEGQKPRNANWEKTLERALRSITWE